MQNDDIYKVALTNLVKTLFASSALIANEAVKVPWYRFLYRRHMIVSARILDAAAVHGKSVLIAADAESTWRNNGNKE